MIFFWIFLILIGALAYLAGSLSTIRIASIFVYHRDLRRLGRGNTWLSNFRRIYGNGGIVTLFVIEIVKDLLPVLIGGWLLGIKEQALLGRAFAGFCLVLGRLWPVFNRFRGSYASLCVAVAAICVRPAIGGMSLAVFIFLLGFKRYMSVATLAEVIVYVALSMILIDESIIMTLCILTGLLVLIRLTPKIMQLIQGEEEKLSFKEDISYKFDQKF